MRPVRLFAERMRWPAGATTTGLRGLRRAGGLLLALGLVSCGTAPVGPEAAGAACYQHRSPLRGHRVCTTEAQAAQAAQAAQGPGPSLVDLPGDAASLVVYVLRDGRGDIDNPVAVAVNGRSVAETLPQSYLRLRLPPGRHQLNLSWSNGQRFPTAPGASAPLPVEGTAGQVRILALDGRSWAWRADYALSEVAAAPETVLARTALQHRSTPLRWMGDFRAH